MYEDDSSTFPEVDIVALDVKSGQEVLVFEKHVMIIHKNRGHSPEELSAAVDDQGLPNQQVRTVIRNRSPTGTALTQLSFSEMTFTEFSEFLELS